MHWESLGVLDLLIDINLPSSFFNPSFLSLCKGLDMPVHGILDLLSVHAGSSRLSPAVIKRTDN